jgi:hypothetical protein
MKTALWFLLKLPGRLIGSVVCAILFGVVSLLVGIVIGLGFPWIDRDKSKPA